VVRPLTLLLIAAIIAPPSAFAHGYSSKWLRIIHPWTMASDRPVAGVGVYMTIRNTGEREDKLLGARAQAGVKVELREPAGGGSAGETRAVPAVLIPAGGSVELSRAGPHVLLTGFKKRLDPYASFPITLIFEKAGRVKVDVMIEDPAEAAPHKD
jgi:copper(I)-binding protein